MNRLNTTVRYAVRATLLLAQQTDRPLSIKAISESEGLSIKYLEQLFLKLRKAGLVKSVRGMHGGYFLARPPEKVTIGDVIRAVQADGIYAAPCTKRRGRCERQKECKATNYWSKLQKLLDDFFNNTTLVSFKE
ncbi:transcriptional regulator [candidate division TA06 bacterium B3_TA06]|uniref:Transcriptional regulator n=1 Tax=candidate division TA06 bacterium B3_TA06 TaxID=2012487 RepID=A0A532V621_UNCT6|nr:MAG: transcriptional regulator [candidate division TA06 bacterium B3_TA06]